MKNVLILLRTNFRISYNSLAKNKKLRLIFAIGIGVAGVVAFYLLLRLSRFLYNLKIPLVNISLAPLILNIVMLIAFIYLLLGSFSIMLSTLYFSSDTMLLLSLPLKERDVFLGRFVFTVFEESIWLLFLMYPFFVGYGVVNQANMIFYAETLLFVLLFPVIPLAVAVFVILPLAKKIHPRKLQNIIMVINVVFGILIVGTMQIANPSYQIVSKDALTNLFSHGFSLMRFLPTNIGVYLTMSLAERNILIGTFIFAIYLVISAGAFCFCILLSLNTYKEGLGKIRTVQYVKIVKRKAEKEFKGFSFLPTKIKAVAEKDVKMIRRDQKLSVSIFPIIAYLAVFFFIFVVVLGKKPSANEPLDLSFFTLLFFFVFSSYMASLQIAPMLFYTESRSVWVLFASKITSQELLWSKFVIPFLLGEAMNALFFILMIFVRHPSINMILVSVALALFLPFIFSTIGVSTSAMFPVFKEVKNPKKIIPGKVVLIQTVMGYAMFGIAFGFFFLNNLLVKVWGGTVAGIAIFILVGILSFAIGFSLMFVGSRRLNYAEIQ
jgi:hypothetical protein